MIGLIGMVIFSAFVFLAEVVPHIAIKKLSKKAKKTFIERVKKGEMPEPIGITLSLNEYYELKEYVSDRRYLIKLRSIIKK